MTSVPVATTSDATKSLGVQNVPDKLCNAVMTFNSAEQVAPRSGESTAVGEAITNDSQMETLVATTEPSMTVSSSSASSHVAMEPGSTIDTEAQEPAAGAINNDQNAVAAPVEAECTSGQQSMGGGGGGADIDVQQIQQLVPLNGQNEAGSLYTAAAQTDSLYATGDGSDADAQASVPHTSAFRAFYNDACDVQRLDYNDCNTVYMYPREPMSQHTSPASPMLEAP